MSSSPASPTHYQTLGVPSSATTDDIKRAYRARAKTLHPDVSDAPDAAARFAQIALAYEVLSDQVRRRAYDRSLLEARPPRAARPSDDDASESGFVQGHYAWVNVAAPRSATPQPAEIDDLYDTFFAGRSGEEARHRSQPKDLNTRPKASTSETPKVPPESRAGRAPGGSPEPHSATPPSKSRSKATRKNAG